MKLYFVAMSVASALALAACGQGGGGGGGLTGADRTSFVEASVSSCKQASQADPNNANIPADAIDRYCTCYSNKMADSISPEEGQRLNTATAAEIQTALGPRINAAIAACKPTVTGG